jgi:hypothetical protein
MSGTLFMENDIFTTAAKIVKSGGSIFYDRVPNGSTITTAAGTGTTRTSITTSYIVPNIAAEVLAVKPIVSPTSLAAADSILAMFDIQGSNFKKQPQQILGPVGSPVLSAGTMRTTPSEWWKVCAPVVAGDQYDWGVTPLVADTHNFKAAYDVMYSSIRSGDPTIYSQVSAVSSFTAAGLGTQISLQLTAADGLYEMSTAVAGESAVVAQEKTTSTTNVQCSAMSPIQSFTYGNEPTSTVVSTSGDNQTMQIDRYFCGGIKFKITNPTVYLTINNDTATTNNANAAHCIRYTAVTG